MLLEGELVEPITSSMGLIRADAETAADCYQCWQNEILQDFGMNISSTKGNMSTAQALESLLPLTSPIRTRFVFLGTKSKWSVFFDNGVQGTDAASAMIVMAGKLNCECIRVFQAKQTLPDNPTKQSRGNYGATILEVYGSGGATRRSIYAANDGGNWKFGQSGTPYQFEDRSAYDRRSIKERFTCAMLVDYLKNLDARPFDANWYTGEAIILRKEGALPKNLVEHSL